MLKVFISQPMCDKTEEEIKLERLSIQDKLSKILKDDIEIIDSFITETPHCKNNGIWYLGKSLEFLANADIVYFAKGWNKYRGCKLEEEIAREYNCKRLYYENTKFKK